MAEQDRSGEERAERIWPRAAALFAIVLATSVMKPSILLAIPFLLLIGMSGVRGLPMLLAATIAMLVVVSGVRDGIWYIERGWALLLGGWFVGVSLLRPGHAVSARALVAVFGAVASATAILAVRGGAWEALDWAFTERIQLVVASTVDAMVMMGGGDAVAPALAGAVQQAADAQAAEQDAYTNYNNDGKQGLGTFGDLLKKSLKK